MGKKNRKEQTKPKKVTYRYVTYTDESGVLQQAFEEVPANGRSQRRSILLGPAPAEEAPAAEAEAVEFECFEVLDEAEALFVQESAQEHEIRTRHAFGEEIDQKQSAQPQTSFAAAAANQVDATVRCYEVPLPEPELHVEYSVSENSHLSDDADYAVDLRRCFQTENEFVKEIPQATKRIVKLGKPGKQFLIQQLFGEMQYSDSDITDCSEIKQAEDDERQIEENIAFFSEDIAPHEGEEANDNERPQNSDTNDMFSEDSDIAAASESAESQNEGSQEAEASDSVHESDFEEPIGPRELEERYMYYSDSDDGQEMHTAQPNRAETLDDRIKRAELAPQEPQLSRDELILISKKTGEAFDVAQRAKQNNDEQETATFCTVAFSHERGRNESAEERKERKEAVKQAKELRRQNHEALKEELTGELRKVEVSRRGNMSNVQGARIE